MQILSQVFNVFVLPMVIIGILLILDNMIIMKENKTSIWIKAGLWLALIFACVVSYNWVLGILELF
ncbi:hypothetical protein [uncultured Maribacter sp.]|uniref:hypothetical protein n=1 Tax=uncultured Maribacter sp. TaxID=431308 RepID=UPI002613B0EC|nr:hypothetical protein [uncultured Maribacter sp.]